MAALVFSVDRASLNLELEILYFSQQNTKTTNLSFVQVCLDGAPYTYLYVFCG